MALNFPNSPTANQIYTDSATGNRYTWDDTRKLWKYTANTFSGVAIQTSAPGSPAVGALWWDSNAGRMYIYYNDGDSGQWVESSPSGPAIDVSLITGYTTPIYNSLNTATQYVVNNNATTLINTGYTTVSFNAGANVAAYGTWTPNPTNGNYQYANSNGAFTLSAPSQNCGIDILLTNGIAAGSITFSGFTVGTGAGTYANTSGYRHILTIRRINNISAYSLYALQ